MKKFTFLTVLISVLYLACFFQKSSAQTLLLDENFDYPAGDLLTAHGWTAHSGAGSQAITVNSSGLTFPGYISSGIGNAALVDNTGEDVFKPFTTQTTGSVYAAFMVKITTVAAGYFFHFSTNPAISTFRGKVFMDASNHFGVSLGSNTGTFASSTFTLGNTYLLVIKYQVVAGTLNDIMSMYIFDSSFPLTEPATPTIGPLTDVGISDIDPASVAIRQFNASENLLIDGIRVGTSWADIAGSASTTPTVTANPASLSGFNYAEGSGPSAEQSFVVSGVNLTDNITLTASTNYEISTASGAAFVATSPISLTQTGGTVANTSIYTRLKSGLSVGNFNNEGVLVASTGAVSDTVFCSGSVSPQLDWVNLQWPGSGTITLGGDWGAYGQVYEPGITEGAGQGAGINCWIGYSTSNTDPSTWTTWIPATYNTFVNDNNDEYFTNIGALISSPGTYYYASRFQLGTAPYVYGGYSASLGGFWNGTTNISGVLTVNPPNQIDWVNLQWPQNGTMNTGATFNVYAQAYEAGLTEAAGQGSGISAWIGYSTSNTNPNTWVNWVPASYNSDAGNNDEYLANIGSALLSPGTYYYASRFKMGLADYVYGGFQGGFWDGTTNVTGILTVAPSWISGWPKAENPTSGGFTAKVNIDAPGTAYFVVLPNGATAPTSAQVKAGQDATGIAVAANLQGAIACATGNTEYLSNVTGLAGSTTYNVYFVAEDIAATLQALPVMVAVTTTASGTAPLVIDPTATSISDNSAILGGNVTSDGGSPITEKGTVWKTSAGVGIGNNKLAATGTTTGVFTHLRNPLPAKTHIYYAAYATNGIGTMLSPEADFYTLAVEPISHVTGFAATPASTVSIDLNWTTVASGADGYLILQKTGATAPTGTPTDAMSYAVGNTIGDGTVAAILTSGLVISQTIIGLSAATQYSFTIIPFSSDGVNAQTYNYYTSPIIPSATATTNMPSATVYTWIGADNAAWNVPANWSPTRTTPLSNDILQFNYGSTKTVTDLQTETIAQLYISFNTVLNLQSAAPVSLSISGATGIDFIMEAGSAFNLNAANAITVNLLSGATAVFNGNITFSATVATAHRLTAVDAGGITFNSGTSFTAGTFFSGNPFGTTNLNSVVFGVNSKYIAIAGSNPFGATQPASVVVFQPGSLYKIMANLTPSLSGRTYADFELDFVGAVLNTSGTAATSIDNLKVTNGTLNFNVTGTPGHTIKGNINVAAGGVLNFAPASAGTVNIASNYSQAIYNTGTLTFGPNSTIVVNVPYGLVLQAPVTFNNLTLTNGIIYALSNLVKVNNIFTGGSPTAYVDGKMAQVFPVASSRFYPIGKSGNYHPVTLTYTALDAPSTVTAEQFWAPLTGTLPPSTTLLSDRYWTITQTGATVFSYDVTLDGTGFSPVGNAVILKKDAGVIESYVTSGTPPAYTATGLSSFSDFALGDNSAIPSLISTPATLTGFTYIEGFGPSGEQTLNVSGTNLSSNISITSPVDYEISTTSGSGFTSNITLIPALGIVSNTSIYVRLKAGLPTGLYNSETLNITSTGAGSNTVICSGSVTTSTLAVSPLSSFGNVCINTVAGPSSFTITGTGLSAGNISVGALAGFTYSATAGGTYTTSLTIPQGGGAFSATVYVKFSPTLVQSYNGNITVSGGSASAVNCAASGNGVNTPATVNTTSPATAVTGTSATCGGNLTDGGCATITARGICYGTSLNPDITGTKTTEAGTTGAFSSNLVGLLPATTYHYRAYATNSISTVYGSNFTFTTLATLPTVITNAATSVTATSAILNGSLNANNSSTTATFEYGTTLAYGTTVTATPSSITGSSNTAISYSLSGLTPNTTYHFRAVGSNPAGTTNGNDIIFNTMAIAPTVITNAATAVSGASATLNGTVNANNQSSTVTFQYGTTIAYGTTLNAVPNTLNTNVASSVSVSISGLTLNTTYHYRAVAVNATGTTNGNDMTFTTTCILPNPAGSISGSANVCQSSSGVVYSVGAIGQATGYVWTVPTGASIVSGNGTNSIVVDFGTGASSGNVTVYGTNICGNGTISTFPITVGSRPTPVINGSASACLGTATNVYSTASGMTAYNWSVSAGGTITAGSGTNSITVTWNTVGPKTVSVNYTNGAGCASLTPGTLNLTVSIAPTPSITGPNQLCAGTTNVVYTTQAGFSNYSWAISYDGIITSGANTNEVTVNWIGAGQRTLSVNYENASGCSAASPSVYNVTVLSLPDPIIFGVSNICQGSSGVAYSTQPNQTNYTWTVSAGGSITSGAGTSAIAVIWNGSGNQTVSVNYANPLGCYAAQAATLNVTVAPKPAAAGTITGPAAVCAGTQNLVYTVAPIANASDYTWFFPQGVTQIAGLNSNTVTVNIGANATSGIVKVLGSNNCGTGVLSPAFNLTINPIPATPVITQHLDTLSSSAAIGNQWYLNGVAIPGATGQKHIAVYSGNYHVVVTLGGCGSAPSGSLLVLPVSVGELEISHSFEVYPNPNKGQFNIKASSAKAVELNIEIYNNLGAMLWKQENVVVDGNFASQVWLGKVPAGMYMVVLRNKDMYLVRKVVVVK